MSRPCTNPRTLTVLVCTHNRVELLSRVLESLDAARSPEGWSVRLFVVANACTDGTHDFLAERAARPGGLALEWIAEPVPGKSNALNRALPLLEDARGLLGQCSGVIRKRGGLFGPGGTIRRFGFLRRGIRLGWRFWRQAGQ